MNVDLSYRFIKQLKKTPKEIRQAFQQRTLLFIKNPFHPFLHNHALHSHYEGKRSINVTGDWRAIYQEVSPHCVMFIALGTHNQLYK
ncbi:MAG: hypothetical protein UW52_C0013G0001 [Candidatus Gottesmanbacteria bacterium GW2011_GWA1_44_24b]|uniref:Plasmid stabilization system n=1 Tax=Candidatus Gottesmanbacteria bacterium GW2011_GWA1_44_24b TaxID=1618437 RepID=A0A0G1LMC0_9BACT|nr:MAG: hypothetical protein UW52_C0013G0001 [Candidatus Gottesmanbacteria bacterium GW2011_GWA1_44_24b]HCM82624.1 hypothetical protein [Patescibacteria group bacterium]